MTSKNKFGFEPLEIRSAETDRKRSVGPMGAAVREAAESLQETTKTKIEQRRENARDAKAFRAALREGRVLVDLALSEIATDDLPRDRLDLEAVASSDEMEELKASMRARGQKEPIEVYLDRQDRYQLKKGWRRLTALRALFEETGDVRFSNVTTRVDRTDGDRMDLYIDMVEENVVREDLSFAEMAQVAIVAAGDVDVPGDEAEVLVGRLYASLHKMKRSYIRSFVFVLTQLGTSLKWPKTVSRNLGVAVARKIKEGQGDFSKLLLDCDACRNDVEQNKLLAAFVDGILKPSSQVSTRISKPREKFEFHVGETKITARNGECRIVSQADYLDLPKERLERAIRAFEAALDDESNPRVTAL